MAKRVTTATFNTADLHAAIAACVADSVVAGRQIAGDAKAELDAATAEAAPLLAQLMAERAVADDPTVTDESLAMVLGAIQAQVGAVLLDALGASRETANAAFANGCRIAVTYAARLLKIALVA